jgi:hypothetical protein
MAQNAGHQPGPRQVFSLRFAQPCVDGSFADKFQAGQARLQIGGQLGILGEDFVLFRRLPGLQSGQVTIQDLHEPRVA